MDRRYAVYFIPTAESKFYKIGSQLIGYDIRRQQADLTLLSDSLEHFLHFGSAHYFGFHATIRGTFKTNLPLRLAEELSSIARNFSPLRMDRSFVYSFNEQDRVVLFRPNPQIERDLTELHAQIVRIVDDCRLKDYVSPETNAIMHTLGTRELQLLQDHGDPRVLEKYVFHFTLANRASPEHLKLLDKLIEIERENLFNVEVKVDRLCIAVQEGRNPYWRILEEYLLGYQT